MDKMTANKNIFDKVFDAAAAVKNELSNLFERENAFIDKESMQKEGILSDTIGLTSIMLLLVAFSGKDENKVITEEDKLRFTSMLETLLPRIYNIVVKDGYLFTPIFSKRETQAVFSAKEKIGSTDTATWVLSLSSLICYAHRKDILTLTDDLLEMNYYLLRDSLSLLLDSQRSDGTWGFGTWKNDGPNSFQAQKSLYFSYSVSVTITDFLYYIRGDIDNPNDNPGKDWRLYCDSEIVDRLNHDLSEDDVIERVLKAREKLQDWLLKDCLPLMPKLASCTTLSDAENKALGIWGIDHQDGGYNFFQLYYTYYLIDMLIGSEVDLRFKSFNFENTVESIFGDRDKELPGAALLDSYRKNSFISENDKKYYFGIDELDRYHHQDQHIEEFFDDYLQQALHNSRAMYTAAKRVKYFWDTSELSVKWNHDDPHINEELMPFNKDKITDPAFVPMALRANTGYVYYVTKKPDYVLDHLFDGIMQEAYDPQLLMDRFREEFDEEKYEDCLPHLWDSSCFSLFITERSIESLVDYFDYICVYEKNTSFETTAVNTLTQEMSAHNGSAFKSEFELAVETKIADYLQSESGKSILLEALNTVTPQSTSGIDFDAFLGRTILELKDTYSDSAEPAETLSRLVDCYDTLRRTSLRRQIREYVSNISGSKSSTEITEIASKTTDAFNAQFVGLMEWVFQYLNKYNAKETRYTLGEALAILEKNIDNQ